VAAAAAVLGFPDGLLSDRTREVLDHRRRSAVRHRRGWLVRRALLIADVLGLACAFLIAEILLADPTAPDRIDIRTEYVLFLLTLPAWVVVAKLYGLYDRDEERVDHSTADEVVDVLHVVTVGAWLLFTGAWLTKLADPDVGKLVAFWAVSIALITAGRASARAVCRRQLSYVQNTVIVGAGEVGQHIAQKLLRHPEYGLNLIGFVDAKPLELQPDLDGIALLGPPERLPELVRRLDVERVVIAFSAESHEETLDLIRSLKDTGVHVAIVPRLFELVGPSVAIHTVEGVPMIGLPSPHLSHSSQLLKRALDVTLASLALLILAPLLALVALLVKRNSPGPVLFRQLRVGLDGRGFHIFKFRTMAADADRHKNEVAHLNLHARAGGDPRMFKIPQDPRVTPIGRVLRRLSLDELPQLFNVLRGEMSLVGPRPLIVEEDAHVGSWGRHRLDLKPGITGLWQVLGRSDISFDEMVKLDYLYVSTWSISNDLRLVLKTLPIVLRGSGSY